MFCGGGNFLVSPKGLGLDGDEQSEARSMSKARKFPCLRADGDSRQGRRLISLDEPQQPSTLVTPECEPNSLGNRVTQTRDVLRVGIGTLGAFEMGFVRKIRGYSPVREACQVSDRARVRAHGRCGSRRIFS